MRRPLRIDLPTAVRNARQVLAESDAGCPEDTDWGMWYAAHSGALAAHLRMLLDAIDTRDGES